jgi:hypothetical protein
MTSIVSWSITGCFAYFISGALHQSWTNSLKCTIQYIHTVCQTTPTFATPMCVTGFSMKLTSWLSYNNVQVPILLYVCISLAHDRWVCWKSCRTLLLWYIWLQVWPLWLSAKNNASCSCVISASIDMQKGIPNFLPYKNNLRGEILVGKMGTGQHMFTTHLWLCVNTRKEGRKSDRERRKEI